MLRMPIYGYLAHRQFWLPIMTQCALNLSAFDDMAATATDPNRVFDCSSLSTNNLEKLLCSGTMHVLPTSLVLCPILTHRSPPPSLGGTSDGDLARAAARHPACADVGALWDRDFN